MSNGDYSKAHRNLYRTDVGSNRPTRRDPFCKYWEPSEPARPVAVEPFKQAETVVKKRIKCRVWLADKLASDGRVPMAES
jgi:hypothetical protein